MRYPSAGRMEQARPVGLGKRLAIWQETRKIARREARDRRQVKIRPLRPWLPLEPGDLPLVFLTHDDRKLLPAFLTHYRRLGVSRFICLDDASKDGTISYLQSQDDVDLWVSPVRYKDARRGRLWREALFSHYGRDRWYLNIDSDEFLVFSGDEASDLRQLTSQLEAAGCLRMPAPMLDMYPLDICAAKIEALETQAPWEIADHFDGQGYSLTRTRRGFSVKGGPRARLFGTDLELIKYPLIFWDDQCQFGPSIHQPLPYNRNFGTIRGVLLHFKVFADYQEVIHAAVENGQHFNGAECYRTVERIMNSARSLSFAYEHSIRYTGSAQLRDLGFLQ